MTTEIPGTDLEEIREDADRFAAVMDRALRAVARRAASNLNQVTVAALSAATPDDLNAITEDWREQINTVLLPWLSRSATASIKAQIAAANAALGQTVISAFDEQIIVEAILAGAENRLVGVGNELWESARASLAEGVAVGESIPKLASRIRGTAEVAAPRATTIARTEVIGASNKSSIEVLRATGLVASKRWIATFDQRVRPTHIAAHGQVVPISSTFTVGGGWLDYPGDFNGPAEEVINCRCSMGYEVEGLPTEDEVEIQPLSAAALQHDGAMIALIPKKADAERMALADGEPVDELHLTIRYLGNASAWDKEQREALINSLSSYDGWGSAIEGRAFGLAHWNPNGPYPCWVLNVGGDGIPDTLAAVASQLAQLGGEINLPELPEEHKPYAAHICLSYTDSMSSEFIEEMRARLGPVTFDRLRVAFAGEHYDVELGSRDTLLSDDAVFQEVAVPWYIERNHEQCSDERPWAVVKEIDGSVEGCHETKDQAVQQLRDLEIAEAEKRENEQSATVAAVVPDSAAQFSGVAVKEGAWTGDGRQFAPSALDWPDLDEINVPLQWQKETSHGGDNDVTVNVGRVTGFSRDGDLIRVTGYIDKGSEDGAEIVRRMHAGTAGGVSIVADDPENADIEWIFPDGCPDMEDVTEEDSEDIELRCWMPIGMIFHSGRIRALTLVDVPAFVEAMISLAEPEPEEVEEQFSAIVSREFGRIDSPAGFHRLDEVIGMSGAPESVAEFIDGIEPLIAASHAIIIPDVPPAEWFEEPTELPPFGALNVTDEGRVYGLLAPRDVAHRSYPGRRVTVPMGNVEYGGWMNRPTIVAGGDRIRTGPITMDCGHASILNADPEPAEDHYTNSCSVVATVRIGESKHGVWVAGALLPGVTPSQVARMLACQLSGDWRKHREKPGKRKFVAALLVPVPGFPVEASPQLRLDKGALVASAVPVVWRLSGDLPQPKNTPMITSEVIIATVIGNTDLPIADRDRAWDGAAARRRVFDMCTSGENVDADCVSRAFLWRDPDADPETMGAYSLGFADVIDGRLQIVPRGVAATAGGRGVDAANIPAADKDRIKTRICTLYDRIRDRFEDWPDCPFSGASSASSLDSLPSWEDIRYRQDLRIQTNELATRLAKELGIEVGV